MRRCSQYILMKCVSLLILFTACNRDEVRTDDPLMMDYLQIAGKIAGTTATRAATDNKLTLSYTAFQDGDAIGFFSYHDKNCPKPDRWSHRDGNDDVNYLKNVPLTYSNGLKRFTAEDITNVSLAKFGITFAYFPYADQGKQPEGYVKADGQPLEMPAKDPHPSGRGRGEHYIHIFTGTQDDPCVLDLLTAQKSHYSNVNYEFRHRFAMILLYLGEGFEPQENAKLKVQLTEHILGAHITRTEIAPSPFEDFPLTIDRVSVSVANEKGYEFGHSFFIAPRIEGYTLLEGQGPRTVYPVILPEEVEIDYIEVVDKTGTLQQVRFTKDAFPNGMEGGHIHPLTIRMEGIIPTISPHEIIDWHETPVVDFDKLPGIYTAENFTDWLDVYNRNVGDWGSMNTADRQTLERFGVYNDGKDPGEIGWTFYLHDHIDCSGITTSGGALIKALPEGVTIDGRGYFLKNLMWDFEKTPPSGGTVGLIGEISGGNLKDLHLDFVTVRNMTTDVPAGCIAGRITGGQIVGCTVRQAVMGCRDGIAGVLAGEMSGGKVDHCKFHGMVQATEMQDETGLYGKAEGVIGKISAGFTENDGAITDDFVNRVVLTD